MKVKKRYAVILAIIFIIIALTYISINISFFDIIKLPKVVYGNIEDIEYSNKLNTFGKLISISYDNAIKTTKTSKINAKIKFLNLITIKEFQIDIADIDLIVTGKAVGLNLEGKGLTVLGNNHIITKNGKENPLENSNIKKGDIIIKIENEEVNSSKDINIIVNKEENKGRTLKMILKRDNELIETIVEPKLELSSNMYKLGIWVKDSVNGVGTLTYIKKDNNRFGALGHPITDSDTKKCYNISKGTLYNCNILGVTKGIKGRPGELKGLFLQGKDYQGTVDKNTEYGVFGQINSDSSLLEGSIIKAGGRFSARAGKAKIRVCVDGTVSKDYDIEIIKTNYQSASNDKSMVIKVTDKELLKKTGGIVQGMSGSPIIQNGKVIGAITHVFVNDPTKGFGIYLDWMINN